MNAYLDTSVVLSKLLDQPNQLTEWGDWEIVYSSLICRVEFFRTLDRLRLESKIDDEERAALQQQFTILWETLYRIPVTEQILDRAAQSFPTVLGSLDAIHLASALAVADPGEEGSFTFLTHDIQLARAAMTVGYGIAGV